MGHKKLFLTWKQGTRLWLNINFSCLRGCIERYWPIQKKFHIIFDEGEKKLDENLDLLSIIKELKYLKTLIEFSTKPPPGLKV